MRLEQSWWPRVCGSVSQCLLGIECFSDPAGSCYIYPSRTNKKIQNPTNPRSLWRPVRLMGSGKCCYRLVSRNMIWDRHPPTWCWPPAPQCLTVGWSSRAGRGRSYRRRRSGRRGRGSRVLVTGARQAGGPGRVWGGARRAWRGRPRARATQSHSAADSGSRSDWASGRGSPGLRPENINMSQEEGNIWAGWHFPRFELNWPNFPTRQPGCAGGQSSAAGSQNAS